MTEESYVKVNAAGRATLYAGPDATALFAAATLRSGIEFYLRTGMKVTAAYSPDNMRFAATGYTGKVYKRSKAGLIAAQADMHQWIEAMKAAIPVIEE